MAALSEETTGAGSPGNGAATPASLRVDLLAPCFWPEVRRGTERFTRDLADGLLERGHRPRLITSHPDRRPSRTVEAGLPVVRVPRPPDGRLRRRLWEPYTTHVPLSYAVLRGGRADVAHAMNPPDALAAARHRRVTGRPAVFSFMGIPDHDGLFLFRRRLDFVLRALDGCDAVVALSEAAAHGFRYWLGHEPRVIPPGVDLDAFRPPPGGRAAEPTIICTADLTEHRKNVPLVIEAFRLVRRERPDARLILSRPTRTHPLAAAAAREEGVELADLDDRAALAAAYGAAWVSVLVSWGEAFGLVLAEALACGTPVVGSRDGGIPEVVGDDEAVGRLVDGRDADELSRALLASLEVADDSGTVARCRGRAERFSTDVTTERYLDLYRELLAR